MAVELIIDPNSVRGRTLAWIATASCSTTACQTVNGSMPSDRHGNNRLSLRASTCFADLAAESGLASAYAQLVDVTTESK